MCPAPCGAEDNTKIMPFIKLEEGNPFYVLPVISEPLFPQFKGPKSPGFTRAKCQRGTRSTVCTLRTPFDNVTRMVCRKDFLGSRSVPDYPSSDLQLLRLFPGEDSRSTSYDDPADRQVLFRDLPDPMNRFAALKKTRICQNYEMCIPPVFTADGRNVVPSKYEDIIPDGTFVAVRGRMKM